MQPTSSMRSVELADGVRRIVLHGFLDAAVVARMEPEFQTLLPAGGAVVVDLAGVEYCGSLGVRLLLTAARLMKRRGGRLVLAAATPSVRQVLEMTGVANIIPIADTAEEARQLLAG